MFPFVSTYSLAVDTNGNIIEEALAGGGGGDMQKSTYDVLDSGVVDDADLFEQIVNPDVNSTEKFIIFKKRKFILSNLYA